MPPRTLRLVVSVVYTPESELDGIEQKHRLRPRSQAMGIAARFVRNNIKEVVPDDCLCSVIVGRQPEAN
jgi:hypothetical protein